MDEKAKSKVLIFIIVVLVILILALGIGGYLGFKYLMDKIDKIDNQSSQDVVQNIENTSAENVFVQEKKPDEKIQIQEDVAAKNILLNNNVVEVRITGKSINKVVAGLTAYYEINLVTEINEKETEPIQQLKAWYDREKYSGLKMNDIVKDITTIKSEDNKEYIVILVEEPSFDISPTQYYYIFDENGAILGNFKNETAEGVEVADYSGNYLQVGENYITQYEAIAPTEQTRGTLKKWKYTIKDGKLEKTLEKTYTEDEFQLSGKSW